MRFESDVISDGTQTVPADEQQSTMFESDVISDGTQTAAWRKPFTSSFESDVISDGTQTNADIFRTSKGLRVM